MIIDKIENHKLYTKISERFEKAFAYLITNDFSQLEDGKYSIDGDNIFALVMRYETKEINDCIVESHRKYIDIQYIAEGTELMGTLPLNNQTPTQEYSSEKDVIFYKEETSLIKFTPKMFAVFFPHDIHQPSIKEGETSKVTKVVIKVKVQ